MTATEHPTVGVRTDGLDDVYEQLDAYMTEHACDTYLLVVACILLGICCSLGLVSNALSLIVWARRQATPTSILLQALAVADMMILGTAGMYRVITQTCFLKQNLDNCRSWYLDYLYPYLTKYIWAVGVIAHSCAVWLTVVLAVNRYLAVCKPLHASTLIRKSYVIAQVTCIFVLSALYCVPRFLELDVETDYYYDNPNVTVYIPVHSELFVNYAYQLWYRNISYFVLMVFVPLIALVVLTWLLIGAVQRARKRRVTMVMMVTQQQSQARSSISDLNSGPGNKRSSLVSKPVQKDQREEMTLTITLIAVVVVFIVCQTPAAINRIFYMVHQGGMKCGEFSFYFSYVADLMNFINASVNFFVYCVCSSRFRADFRRYFRCCSGHDVFACRDVRGCGDTAVGHKFKDVGSSETSHPSNPTTSAYNV